MPVTDHSRSSITLYQRDQYARGGLGRRYWDWRDERVFRRIPFDKGIFVDLGCGEGITLEKLVRRFPRATVRGIDALPENVEICRRYGLPAEQGDVYRLNLPDGLADAVFFLEVIEHLARPEAALREIRRLLKPGGILLVLFPNDFAFALARRLTLRFREAAYDPGHVRQWTPAALGATLRSLGFQIRAAESMPFRFWPISLHGLVVAERQP